MKHVIRMMFVAASLLFASSAFASHYDLADVTFLPKETQEKVIQDGMETTADLLEQVLTPAARKAFSEKYNMPQKDVDALAHKLELMQIIGVGPKAADLLIKSGVKNLQGLASADPNALLEALLATNRQFSITGVQPDMTVVKDWVDKAKKIKKHLS